MEKSYLFIIPPDPMDDYLEGVRVMTMLYVRWVCGEGSNTIFLQVAKVRGGEDSLLP